MGFASLCKSIISEYFLCSKYPLLFLKNTWWARGELREEGEVYLMLRAYECTWYCQYVTQKQIWLLSSVIITLPNQVMFCAVKKRRQQVQLSPFPTDWLFEFSGTLGPTLPCWKQQQMASRRGNKRPTSTKHSTLLLPCSVQSVGNWEKYLSGLLHPEADAYASIWAHVIVVCVLSPASNMNVGRLQLH